MQFPALTFSGFNPVKSLPVSPKTRFTGSQQPPDDFKAAYGPKKGDFSDYPPPSHDYSGAQFVRSNSTASSTRPAGVVPERKSSQNATTQIPAHKVPPRTSSLGATKEKDKKKETKFA